MRNRQIGLMVAVLAILLLAARHPSAEINILTQDQSDPAPHRVQAAVDLGVVAVSFLWTWSSHRLIDAG
ncbi:hypothetical protein EAH87_06825 [Sphingomonas koreensis]|nr:hypothetical protein EAH87_06825 [Sphingomonas koreensis]